MRWMMVAATMVAQVNSAEPSLTDRDLIRNITEPQTLRLVADWKLTDPDSAGGHTKTEWVVFAKIHGHDISVSHDLDPKATTLTLGSGFPLPKLKDPNAWVATEAAKLTGMRLVQVTTSLNSGPTRIFSLFKTIDLSKGLTVGEVHRQFNAYVKTLDRLART